MVSPATASKSETVMYRHVNGENYASDAVTADGHAEHTDYRGVYDGPFGTIKTTIRGKVTSEGALQLRNWIRARGCASPCARTARSTASSCGDSRKTATSSILRFDSDGRIVVHETRWFDKK
jgi:hypothetical protein